MYSLVAILAGDPRITQGFKDLGGRYNRKCETIHFIKIKRAEGCTPEEWEQERMR